MQPLIERVLNDCLERGVCRIGQVAIHKQVDGFTLLHRDDLGREDLEKFSSPNDAFRISRFDDSGMYRPLRTAPTLRHGWSLELRDLTSVHLAIDLFYPGRMASLRAWQSDCLTMTPLRRTLARQSGMYRIAAKISDQQLDQLVGGFCRSHGGQPGCLRTILWRRDDSGAPASTQLPCEKFDPRVDQAGSDENVIPLLCQEACNLLVSAAREVVKAAS